MFRDEGVSLPTIRKASRAAAKRFGAEYPFAVKRFDTDGHSDLCDLEEALRRQGSVEELNRGQYVFDQIARPFFKKLEYSDHNGREGSILANGTEGRIVLDPERSFGQPIDAETGVQTNTLYMACQAGGGQDAPTVAEWFDVSLERGSRGCPLQESLR